MDDRKWKSIPNAKSIPEFSQSVFNNDKLSKIMYATIKEPISSTLDVVMDENVLDELFVDFYNIYLVPYELFDEIDLNKIPSYAILIPIVDVPKGCFYKIIDKHMKLDFYKRIKSDIDKYRGKKNDT